MLIRFIVRQSYSICNLTLAQHLRGAPDLVVEVLSPGTVKIDKTKKYRLYEKYGTQEYWLEDVISELIEAWTLVDGVFQYIGAYGAGETFDSPLLGKTIDVTLIFPLTPAESTPDESQA